MSFSQTSRRPSNLFNSNTQAVSFLTKENITIKNNRSIKISYVELSPYIHEQFGFIDPDFPHVHSSINQNQPTPIHSLTWIPAEQLIPHPNYSDSITTLDSPSFHKKSINHALILINWFTKDIFNQIFLKQLSPFHLYGFDVMIDGVFVHMPIDSYVPVNPNTNKVLYTRDYKNSIFPCIYQKLMAKIYGDYYSISSEFIEIVELNTMFCRQEISMTQKKIEIDLQKLILKKIAEKSIVCFRTRNSIRLESFGLESNHIYVIIRLIQKEQEPVLQFLELQGSNWIGKYSKLRSDWLLQDPNFIKKNKIVMSEQHKENYMSLKDMKGISREIIILNNTFQFHKNYYVCQNTDDCLSLYTFTIDKNNKIMLKTNFKRKKCYNSIMLFQKCTINQRVSYKLICTSFHQNKSSNYLQANLVPGDYAIIIYNTHPQEDVLPYNLTLFSSHTFLDITPENTLQNTLTILENGFLEHFANIYRNITEPVLFKHLYHSTGLAFIYIKPNQYPIDLFLNIQIFKKSKIVGLNLKAGKEQIFNKNYKKETINILIFRCQWSKLQNIDFEYQKIDEKIQIQKLAFPPIGSTKIIQRKTS